MDGGQEARSDRVALTIGDAAKRLAVSRATVRRLLVRGALVRVRLGRCVRVLAASVDQLAECGGVARAK